jgi:hypothetical protein
MNKGSVLILVLWLPVVVFGYWFVLNFSVNVVWWDLWDIPTTRVVKYLIDHSLADLIVDLFKIHNDSRLTFPLIFIIPISLWTSLNIKTLYLLGITMHFICVLFLFYLLKKDLDLNIYKFIIISTPILLYSFNPIVLIRFISNLGAFTYPFLVFTALLSFHFLHKARKSLRFLILAILSGIACSFSGASGLTIWIAGLMQLLLQKMDKKWEKICIWLLSAFMVYFTHFYILARPPFYAPDPHYPVHNFDTYLVYIKTALLYPFHKFLCFLGVLGGEVARDPQTALLFGFVIFLTLILIIFLNRKNLEMDRYAKWYGLLFFSLLVALELTITRSGDLMGYFGPPDNIFFVPAYRHYPVTFLPLLSIYALAVLYCTKSENRETMITFRGVLLALLIFSFILNFSSGMKTAEEMSIYMQANKRILETFDVHGDELLKNLHPDPNFVRSMAEKLRALELNVFADKSEVLLYKPDHTKLFELQSGTPTILRIDKDVRFALYQHPTSNENRSLIVFENVEIPEKAKMKFGIALHPGVWDPNKGDGVVFEIYVKSNGAEECIFSKYVDPKNNPEERKWNDFEIDLSKYSGKTVTIILSTLPGPKNDNRWDWAYWGDLKLTRW